MDRSDEQLMKDFQSGDKAAMQVLFQNNKVRILNFCLGLLGNRADAEEVSSDVFIALMKYKDYYDPNRTFSTWIYTVARNQCFNLIRKRKQTVSMWFKTPEKNQYESWDVPDEADQSRESLAKKERALQVRQAINKLPYEQREALVLKQYHGFTYAQISEILKCSLEKTKILIFRAKQNLKGELASFIREENS